MKQTLFALIPWMVLVTAAHGQVRSADVAYAHLNTIPTRAFRLGDECFVPIDGASLWGWISDVKGDQAKVYAEGRTITVSLRSIAGRPSLPVRRVVQQLGGGSNWILGMETLEVWSELTQVSYRRGHLQVEGPLTIKPTVYRSSGPEGVVVELTGARLGNRTRLDLDHGAVATQPRPNTVRITLDREDLPEFENKPSRELIFSFEGAGPLPKPTAKPPIVITNDVIDPQPEAGTGTPSQVRTPSGELPLFLNIEGPKATLLEVRLPGIKKPTFTKPDPSTLEVRLPDVFLTLPDGFRLNTEAVTSASAKVTSNGTTLTLALSRPMGVEVWSEAKGVQIQLLKPNIGNGRIAGKIVVVDPGHGGTDRGANRAGVFEKDLNLAIGKLLSEELASQGATVIMTRKTDVFHSLGTRADIANRNRADFFISVHINSTAKENSTSGTITFHHKGSATGRLLAECIHAEISKVNDLPDIGVWSDGKIYDSGFAVLRQTQMPGVLLELGFINHSRDRARMVQKDFQESVAKAVVRGLKVYLGDE